MANSRYRNVVLIYPKTGYEIGVGIGPPHSILAIGAYLVHHKIENQVVIIDQRIDKDWKGILKQELEQEPLLVGISSKTGVQLKNAIGIATFIREHSPITPVVFGGVHISLMPEQSIQSELIDFGIIREGEETMLDLVKALNENKLDEIQTIPGLIKKGTQKVVNYKRNAIDMNNLPIDRFSIVNVERYILNKFSIYSHRELDLGETSRGCCWQCAYCYNTAFNSGKWRSMSTEKTIEMIRYNTEKYKLKSIWIRDDNFFVNIPRAAAIIEYIARLNLKVYFPGITVKEFKRMPNDLRQDLKKIGGTLVRFGVESGSDRILHFIKKGITSKDVYEVNLECKNLNVIPSYNFMIGFPREKREDVLATIKMMKKLKRENPKAQLANINLYTPYPGTDLFDIFKQDCPDDVPKTIHDWLSFHHLNLKKGNVDNKERRFYENIIDISYLISDSFYQTLPKHIKILCFPIRFWFLIRWHFNAFRFAPEIILFRKFKKIFFSID